MCLNYSSGDTKKLEKRFSKRGGKLNLWKIYEIDKKYKSLTPPYYGVTFFFPGERVSNRSKDECTDFTDGQNIYRGIHVYTRKNVAKDMLVTFNEWRDADRVVVRVECHKKDLIGAGHREDAAFYRITIPQKEWNKIWEKSK